MTDLQDPTEAKVVLPPIHRARSRHWDETFLVETLLNQTSFLEDHDEPSKTVRKISKVWVCGPPTMTDDLD
jgi:hypothetical protein